MELALVCGLSAIGYYLNKNDNQSPPKMQYTVPQNDIPNGPDIYNQDRLTLAGIDQINRGRSTYNSAENPQKTNVIPTYYNQLGSVINRDRWRKLMNDRTRQDLSRDYVDPQKIYYGDELIVYQPYNDILVDPVLSTDTPLPYTIRDPESMGEGYVASDRDLEKNRQLKNVIGRKVKMATESFDNVTNSTAQQYFDLQQAQHRLLDVSERITDNTSAIRGICGQDGFTNDNGGNSGREPEFLKFFEEQTFDNYTDPDAPNSSNGANVALDKSTLADRERDIASKNGWGNYNEACDDDMTYSVISKNDFEFHVQNPPMPLYRNKYGYGSNDQGLTDVNNFKRELFTGNLSTYYNKAEPQPFFKPVRDMTWQYGTPIRSEEEDSRYIPSLYRQGETLFEPQRVTPGLNLDYNDIGQQGYQDMYRALPKTTDEIRIASNPKISYPGRMASEGQRGTAGPIQAPVMSYRPDGFKITSDKDFLPNSAPEVAPKVRANFDAKMTNRATDHVEYVGTPYNSAYELGQTVPEWMLPAVKESTRQNFLQQEAGRKFAPYGVTGANRESYDNVPTQRAMTGENNYINPAYQDSGTYADLTDVARTTMKSVNMYSPSSYVNVANNVQRPTVHYGDLLAPTMKDLTVENPLNPHVSGHSAGRVYNNDQARTTIKETTLDNIMPANIYGSSMMPTPITQNMRTTIKEQTSMYPTNTMMSAVGQYTMPTPYTDNMRTTVKEQTAINPYNTMFSAVGQYTMPTPMVQNMRTTTKEQTAINPYNTMLTAVGQYTMPTPHTDNMRTTVKEQTAINPYNTMLSAVGQYTMPTPYTDNMRTTTKEQTSINPYNTMLTAVGQYTMPTPYTDNMRTTVKEQTAINPYNTMMTPVGKYTMPTPMTQNMRTTTKEQTSVNPYNTMLTAVGQYTMPTPYTDNMRTTVKEQTAINPYNTMLTAVGQAAGQTPLTQQMRTTMKEQTAIIPNQTMITSGVNRPQVHNEQPMRTTVREQTGNHMHMGPADSFSKAGVLNLYIAPNATLKDMVAQNNYIPAASMSKGSGYISNPQEMRTTIKEQTGVNNYMTPIGSGAPGMGYLTENPEAKTTMRQMTSENDYIAPLGTATTLGVYDGYYNAPQDNRKECLQVYRAPTDSNTPMGPIILRDGVFVRDDDNMERNPAPSYTFNNQIGRLRTNQTVNRPLEVPETMYVDPQILNQLSSNPYALQSFYQN
jgi:hypothetical protein